MPITEDVLMIDPPPPLRMAGIAARVPRKTPLACTPSSRSQISTVMSSTLAGNETPALLNRTSSRPCAARSIQDIERRHSLRKDAPTTLVPDEIDLGFFFECQQR